MSQTSFTPNAILVTTAGVIGATASGSCVNLTAAQLRSFASVYSTTEVDTAIAGKADKATTLAGYGITNGVSIDGAETISGAKRFSTTITIGAVGGPQLIPDFGGVGRLVVGSVSRGIYIDPDNKAVSVASDVAIGWSGNTVAANGIGNAKLTYGATGPFLRSNADGGFQSKNFAGTADAPITASKLSASGNDIDFGITASGTGGSRLSHNGDTSWRVGDIASGATSFVVGAYSYIRGNLQLGGSNATSPRATINAGTSGTLKFRDAADTADAAITAGAATFSGGVAVGPITFAVLNATTPSLGAGEWRVTDRGNRRAYPDGTNWRWVGDDSIIL